jgi:folate-dependent phosphoribosylglycinamide formyltransferase PurN
MPKIAVIVNQALYNLQMLIEAYQTQNLKDGQLSLVVSGDEWALELGNKAGLKTVKLAQVDNPVFDSALAKQLQAHTPDLIVALDWPHRFTGEFLAAFPNRVMGVHPALPGQFLNADPMQSALEAYAKKEIKWTGCNVHYVAADGAVGAILRQMVVPIEHKDDVGKLAERMRKSEKWLLLKAIKQFLYEQRTQKRGAPARSS